MPPPVTDAVDTYSMYPAALAVPARPYAGRPSGGAHFPVSTHALPYALRVYRNSASPDTRARASSVHRRVRVGCMWKVRGWGPGGVAPAVTMDSSGSTHELVAPTLFTAAYAAP